MRAIHVTASTACTCQTPMCSLRLMRDSFGRFNVWVVKPLSRSLIQGTSSSRQNHISTGFSRHSTSQSRKRIHGSLASPASGAASSAAAQSV